MLSHRFKNLEVRHEGMDFLANGTAEYIIENYDEGNEATFEKCELYDLLGKEGYITSKEVLGIMGEVVLEQLNQNPYLCRNLGNKIV
ncbi:hypothetical protein CCP3SC1AL1_2230007 [Gammaproteobacteria bacterium]